MNYKFGHIDFLNEGMGIGSVFGGKSDDDQTGKYYPSFYAQSSGGQGMPRGLGGNAYVPGDDPTNEDELALFVDWWTESMGTYEGAANTISRLMVGPTPWGWQEWYNFFYEMFFGGTLPPAGGGHGNDGRMNP